MNKEQGIMNVEVGIILHYSIHPDPMNSLDRLVPDLLFASLSTNILL